MGERPDQRSREVAALRLGLDLGLSLIDTAEMYADGEAERVVAEAIAGRRDEVLLVSKVLPSNASYEGTLRAAERSLERLCTDRIDLYLLHWPGEHPLEETLRAFVRLQEEGKIRGYGVSNFDRESLERVDGLPGGDSIAADQVLYNLTRRRIERRIVPWCRERGITIMAYSPLQQGRLDRGETLREIARRNGCTSYQIALAWTIRDPGVVTIPKARDPYHVRENAAVAGIELSEADRVALDREFPAPRGDLPLETL